MSDKYDWEEVDKEMLERFVEGKDALIKTWADDDVPNNETYVTSMEAYRQGAYRAWEHCQKEVDTLRRKLTAMRSNHDNMERWWAERWIEAGRLWATGAEQNSRAIAEMDAAAKEILNINGD